MSDILSSNNQMPDGVTPTNSKETTKLLSSLGSLFTGAVSGLESISETLTEKIVPSLDKVGAEIKNATSKTFGKALQAGLGPLNLLTGAIKDISGFDVASKLESGFGGLVDKLNPFKPTKRNPKPSDVAKKGDAGSLLIFNALKQKDGEDDAKRGIAGLLSGLTGGAGVAGLVSKLGPMLLKALPIAALIGGLIWMAIDGITGWMKSGEWGVSKFSGLIGGMLGGTDKGLQGAFKGMGKWALIGAGIGSFIPVIGTLIGGLIGAAIGAILGWIGGEKIAKALDKVGKWFKDMWNKTIDGLKNFVSSIGDFFRNAWQGIMSGFSFAGNAINEWIIQPVGNFLRETWSKVSTTTSQVLDWITDWVITPVGNFFTGLWQDAQRTFNQLTDFFTEWIIEPMRSLFAGFGDWIFENTPDWLKSRERKDAEAFLGLQETAGQRQALMNAAEGLAGREFYSESDLIRALRDNPALIRDLKDVPSFRRSYQVNDAIIKDDMVIEPSPDDTLIATKNPITNLSDLGAGNGEVAELLRELIRAVREQNLNITVPTNFDSYRTQGPREY